MAGHREPSATTSFLWSNGTHCKVQTLHAVLVVTVINVISLKHYITNNKNWPVLRKQSSVNGLICVWSEVTSGWEWYDQRQF